MISYESLAELERMTVQLCLTVHCFNDVSVVIPEFESIFIYVPHEKERRNSGIPVVLP